LLLPLLFVSLNSAVSAVPKTVSENMGFSPEGNMKTATKFAAFMLVVGTSMAQAPEPKGGFVPDEKTSIRVAEAILPPICGEECVLHQGPFSVTLAKGVWIVSGAPPKEGTRGGGAVEIRIDRRTGAVISYVFAR
jgi:hypothetical protein